MTLILSCVTRDVIYQVSDRRLTTWSDPPKTIDDDTNKATLFNGRIAIGYTGFAFFGSERCDDWLARILSAQQSSDLGEIATAICEAATQAFSDNKMSGRHAFHAVGWMQLEGTPGLVPIIATIHNGIDSATGSWHSKVLPKFEYFAELIDTSTDSVRIQYVGASLSLAEKAKILRGIRKCVVHRHSRPETVREGLVRSVYWLSKRHPRIGSNLIVVVLPRSAIEEVDRTGEMFVAINPPTLDCVNSCYWSPKRGSTLFGPNIVLRGIIMTNFQVRKI